MAKYSVSVNGTAGADPQTFINLFSAGNARGYIYDVLLGSDATPADQTGSYEMMRTTAVGTEGAGFTPTKLDPDSQASDMDAGVTHSAEPTETASSELLRFAVNQRATFRWVAAPGSELVIPATASNGINLVRRASTANFAVDCTILFEE